MNDRLSSPTSQAPFAASTESGQEPSRRLQRIPAKKKETGEGHPPPVSQGFPNRGIRNLRRFFRPLPAAAKPNYRAARSTANLKSQPLAVSVVVAMSVVVATTVPAAGHFLKILKHMVNGAVHLA